MPRAAKNRIYLISLWMWKVSDNRLDMAIKVEFCYDVSGTKTPVDRSAYRLARFQENYKYGTAQLLMPQNVICTYGNYQKIKKNGADYLVFKFLCSGNWTITSNQRACHLAP